MSKLDELIEKLCPNGVEYKKLESCLEYEQPTKYIVNSTKYDDLYSIPVLTAGQSFILGYTNENNGIYNASQDNPVIIFDDFTTGFHWVDFKFKVKSSAIKILRPKNESINFRYIYYAMSCIKFEPGTHTRHWISIYSQFTLPVPPLEVQCEIVRILDDFTLLSAELSAELKARQKQYEYYRNEILKNVNGEEKEIKEIYNRIKGTPITARKMKEIEDIEGDIKVFAGGKTMINTFENKISKANITKVPSVLIQSRGLIDFIFYEKPFTFKNEMWAYTNKEKVTVKYLFYVLKNNIKYFRESASGMGSMPQISLPVTENFKIKIPSFEEQKRIVDILDNLDILCNSISEGIPAEIEARQKQYEYYRDKLLTFKELKV